MPSDPEEEATTNRVLMDMDLDLAASWQLDQIDESQFLLSISEHQYQPFSPLWAFSDDGNHGGFMGGGGGGFRLSDCSRVHSDIRNPEVETDNGLNPDEKKKLPSPLTGLIPNENPDGYCLIKERMTQALRYFKDLSDQHVLAQVWAPIKHNGRHILTTSGQPFVLDPNSNGLPQYRLVSQIYMFSIDGDNDGNLGLPGRVFKQKLPEWTPNVQYYSSEEFPRLTHALHYNVRGTLALPVFEPSVQSCVGVLELIMTSQKINYAPEVDKVCKALEAVNLRSSEILDHQSTQICNQARQNALAEILEIITVVCETHELPLAQTWVPCMHGTILANGGSFMKTCSSFDGSCKDQVCMSTTDVAFYVVDAHMWGFHDACAEHHLQNGQGVCGRAFASRSACFCRDITEFCKTEYPLVHYARMFKLKSSFAICLQNERTGDDDYVLEFFLPVNVESYEKQRVLLGSIFATIKEHIGSLRVASGRELEQESRSIEIVKAPGVEKQVESRLNFDASSSPKIATVPDGATLNGESNDNSVKENVVIKDLCKKPERKRGKAEKTISLEVLQQYFAGSLKDAAKSLGVCPTTMKRICRQHGISRWPSRKINKVNRSLSKLKRVIESVQGGEGTTFSLTSLAAANPVPVTVGSVSWAANLNGPNQPSKAGPIPSQSREDKKDINVTRAHEHDKQAEKISASIADFSRAYRPRTASGSREESIEMPTSQGSCQGSPQNDQVVSPIFKHETRIECLNNEQVCQEMGEVNLAAALSIQNGFITAPDEQFEQMQLEDVGSSHDLKNLCPQNEQPLLDEHVITEYSWTKSPPRLDSAVKEKLQVVPSDEKRNLEKPRGDIITIKAAYREDIIRFRLGVDSGIVKLREEVAKRFKLEIEMFDVKYLDDDHEWVLIACDADLQECIDLSRSSGNRIVRMVVNETGASLGSSCDSSGNEQ